MCGHVRVHFALKENILYIENIHVLSGGKIMIKRKFCPLPWSLGNPSFFHFNSNSGGTSTWSPSPLLWIKGHTHGSTAFNVSAGIINIIINTNYIYQISLVYDHDLSTVFVMSNWRNTYLIFFIFYLNFYKKLLQIYSTEVLCVFNVWETSLSKEIK